MKITRLSVFHVDLPLAKPYWLSGDGFASMCSMQHS